MEDTVGVPSAKARLLSGLVRCRTPKAAEEYWQAKEAAALAVSVAKAQR